MAVKIHALNQVANETLRYRAQRASSGRSTEFIAVVNGVESGLLSYEDWRDEKVGFIYEIYVLSDFRQRGVGTALLLHAEDLAIQLGSTKISLDARAFDGETNQEVLLVWYKGRGYARAFDDTERMEKSLVQ